MTVPTGERKYLGFDPKAGYPGGLGVYYECTRCGEIIPSLPPDSVMCKCRNIRIDVDYGRIAVSDDAELKAFMIEEASDQ